MEGQCEQHQLVRNVALQEKVDELREGLGPRNNQKERCKTVASFQEEAAGRAPEEGGALTARRRRRWGGVSFGRGAGGRLRTSKRPRRSRWHQTTGRTDMGQADGQKGRRMVVVGVGQGVIQGENNTMCQTDTPSQNGGRGVILPNDGEKH